MSAQRTLDGPDEAPDHGPDLSLRITPYAMTGGRTRAAVELPIETIVASTPMGLASVGRLGTECRRILGMAAAPLAIAELSAHLRLPLGVIRVLVGDLLAEGLVRTSVTDAARDGGRPDVAVLEKVLDGLRSL